MVSNRIKYTIVMTLLAVCIAGCSVIDTSTGDSVDRHDVNTTTDNSSHDNNNTDSYNETTDMNSNNDDNTSSNNDDNTSSNYGDDSDAEVNIQLHKNNITDINQNSATGKLNSNGDYEVFGCVGCLNPVTFKVITDGGTAESIRKYEEADGMARGTRYCEYFIIPDATLGASVKLEATINGKPTIIGTAVVE